MMLMMGMVEMVATSSLLLFYHHRPRHDHDDCGGYDVDDYYFDYGDKDQRNGGNLFPSLVLPTMMMIMDIMIMMMISLK